MGKSEAILSRSETIDEKYTVQFFIKKGSHAETYRVKDKEGKPKFLKLFQLSKLHRTQFDGEGNIKEIEYLKSIKHPNVVQYRDSGEWLKGNQRLAWLVLDFISGEALEDRLRREHTLNAYKVKQIVGGVLNGLKYLTFMSITEAIREAIMRLWLLIKGMREKSFRLDLQHMELRVDKPEGF